MARLVMLATLLAPVVAIQGYLLMPAETDTVSEFDARVTYVSGMQRVDNEEIEVDLGKFDASIVRPEINKVLRVRFHLAGLIPYRERGRYEDFFETNNHRFRDRVITELTRTEAQHLADPRLSELRVQLTTLVNGMTETPLFRNLVFSNYSVLQQ